MPRPTVVLELAHYPGFERDLAVGGLFVAGCTLAVGEDCELFVRGTTGVLAVDARVVFADPARGAGFELVGADPTLKARLVELARGERPSQPQAPAMPEPDEPAAEDDEREPIARGMHERLRGLSMVEQVKVAGSADPTERMALERIYGKNVWEALLRNPRLTAPEVTRLARMGTLPRVMLETILNNSAWLNIPEVRRALLSNPRLGVDQIIRVLRLLPKHELKLVSTVATYPMAVRDQAKKLVKGA